MNSSVIEVGKGVILKKGKNLKYICVSEKKTEKMENFYFSCSDMIGKPFGTAFKVINKTKLEEVSPIQVEEFRSEYEKLAQDIQEEETKDNRDIMDSKNSQKLDKESIMTLREEGLSGEKIVEKLVENSATFKGRTQFSQAKYLKKKEKKYIAQFVVLKPCTRLLCEMYFSKSPDKILDIRPDTLAQILTYSNVQQGFNVLLMETCRGLIAGAVMERLGDEGTVVQVHQGNNPMRTVVEQFNFTVNDVSRLACSFPLEKIEVFKELMNRGESPEVSREEMLETFLGKKFIKGNASNIETSTTEDDADPAIKEIPNKQRVIESTDGKTSDSQQNTISEEQYVDIDNKSERTTTTATAIKITETNPDILIKADSREINDNSKHDQTELSDTILEASNRDIKNSTHESGEATDSLRQEIDKQNIDKRENKRKRKRDDRNNTEYEPSVPRVTYLTREQRAKECEKAIEILKEKRFDCLVIAAKYHPKNILLSLLEFLPPSRPFVVYSQYKEPLMECYVSLLDEKRAVNVHVSETWFRNIQVLSDRTRPEITMSASGGYLLRGITTARDS